MKLLPMVQTAAECGGCTLCCKVFNVPALGKPKDQWCQHARKGQGCAIYTSPDKPAVCSEFKCLWLTTIHEPAVRPDRVHGVLVPHDNKRDLVLHEDPGYPRMARQRLRILIDAWVEDGTRLVLVVCGDQRSFFGNPALVEAYLTASGGQFEGRGEPGRFAATSNLKAVGGS